MQAIEALETESNSLSETETETALETIPETAPPETPASPASDSPEPAHTTTPTGGSADMNKGITEEAPVTPAATNSFQPFATKKKMSKRSLIIIISIVVVIVLAVAGYFGWQYLQSQDTTTAPAQTTTETNATGDTVPTDTENSVTEVVTEIETQLDGMDTSEYDDTTLDDATLYN